MSNTSDYFNKKATFIQHRIPALGAGNYEITVKQEIEDLNNQQHLTTKSDSVSKKFSILAPRFSIDTGLVHLTYPPDIQKHPDPGPFDTCLPHIVLQGNMGLPWMRSPIVKSAVKDSSSPELNDPESYDADVAPWMAVLVLQEDDLNTSNGFADTDNLDQIEQLGLLLDFVSPDSTIHDYGIPDVYDLSKLKQSFKTGTLPKDTYALFSNKSSTSQDDIKLGLNNKPLDAATYMDIPFDLFYKIAPSLEDLKYMAHVRQVDTTQQPRENRAPAKEQFAVVLGNRIPKQGLAKAFLVSLENMSELLSGGSQAPAGISKVRLPVFYSWKFQVGNDDSANFEHILKTLNTQNTTPTSAPEQTGTLPHPYLSLLDLQSSGNGINTPQDRMNKALRKGYVPFNHITRGTDGSDKKVQTVSWYRGPLVPYQMPVGEIVFQKGTEAVYAAPSADHLLRYDKDLHFLDVSYAAAWQLGRLICLHDKPFSQALYQWKRTQDQQIIAALEQQILEADYPALQATNQDDQLNAYQKLQHAVAYLLTTLNNR